MQKLHFVKASRLSPKGFKGRRHLFQRLYIKVIKVIYKVMSGFCIYVTTGKNGQPLDRKLAAGGAGVAGWREERVGGFSSQARHIGREK